MVAAQDRRRLAPARWPGDVPRLRGFGAAGDPLWWSAKEMQDEINKVSTYIDQLNADFGHQRIADPGLRDGWLAFFEAWGRWRAEQDPGQIWGNARIVEQAREFGRQAEQYRARFVVGGGRPTGPVLITVPAPPESPSAWLTALKWGTVALGIGGTIYMVARFVPRGKAKKPKEATA